MTTNYDLDLEPTTYSEETVNSEYSSKHHLSMNCKIFNYSQNGKVPLFLKNFTNLPGYIDGEISHVVGFNEVNRLDLVAWKYYKTPELFWVIMAVNNILNPFELEEATILRIIPLEYIEYNLLRYTD